MFRVYLLFPPRSISGARSNTTTRAPESAAARAAQRAALPPPTTATSIKRIREARLLLLVTSLSQAIESYPPTPIEPEHTRGSRLSHIVVLGAGAIGGQTVAHLTRSGEDVVMVDPWFKHVYEVN